MLVGKTSDEAKGGENVRGGVSLVDKAVRYLALGETSCIRMLARGAPNDMWGTHWGKRQI
jgi:hypothetical protein